MIEKMKNKLGIESPSKKFLDISDAFRAAALPLCGDKNVEYFLTKMDNLEINNRHQKSVIDRLSRKIQKLKSDKKRLLDNLDEVSFVFVDKISTPHFQEEEWCFWYQCLKCHHYSIGEGYKFCPQCGANVKYLNEYATHDEKYNSKTEHPY